MARARSFQLSLGAMLSQTFAVYLRNLVPFLGIGVLILSPWIALKLLVKPSEDPMEQLPILVLDGLLNMLLAQVLTGALTYGVVQRLRGKAPGLGEILNQGMRSFLPVLGTGLLAGILIGLATLCLIVPGVILSILWYVALPMVVMEGTAGMPAMKRSRELIRGSAWVVFLAMVLVIVAISILGGVFGVLLVASKQSIEGALNSAWFDIPLQVGAGTFGSTMAAVAYFQLRAGKENVDVQGVAAVFD